MSFILCEEKIVITYSDLCKKRNDYRQKTHDNFILLIRLLGTFIGEVEKDLELENKFYKNPGENEKQLYLNLYKDDRGKLKAINKSEVDINSEGENTYLTFLLGLTLEYSEHSFPKETVVTLIRFNLKGDLLQVTFPDSNDNSIIELNLHNLNNFKEVITAYKYKVLNYYP